MSAKDTVCNIIEVLPVGIASGATNSDAAALGGLRLFGVVRGESSELPVPPMDKSGNIAYPSSG